MAPGWKGGATASLEFKGVVLAQISLAMPGFAARSLARAAACSVAGPKTISSDAADMQTVGVTMTDAAKSIAWRLITSVMGPTLALCDRSRP
jgi:hypothetical protein